MSRKTKVSSDRKIVRVVGSTCDICKVKCDDVYCEKCWKIVLAIAVDPERFEKVHAFLTNGENNPCLSRR